MSRNNLFKLAISAIVVFSFTVEALNSQNARPQSPQPQNANSLRQKPQPDLKKLSFLLGLDEAESQQLEAMMNKHRQEFEARRQAHQSDRESERLQMEALHKQHKEELSGILNESQLAIFDLYMKQYRPPKPDEMQQPSRQRPQQGQVPGN